jgi:hypothetical protein
MLSDADMISMLPSDVRASLAVSSPSIAGRKLAWLIIENSGNPCPPQALDSAIDRWLALGAPEPDLVAICPLCGGCMSTDDSKSYDCLDCDLQFGGSWGARDPKRILWLKFDDGVLVGNDPGWTSRQLRWPMNTDPSDFACAGSAAGAVTGSAVSDCIGDSSTHGTRRA